MTPGGKGTSDRHSRASQRGKSTPRTPLPAGHAAVRPLRLHVALPGRAYPVIIGPGALSQLAAEVMRRVPSGRGIVIADRNALRHHGPVLRRALDGLDAPIVVVPPGEASKSLAQSERLYAEVQRRALPRDGFVLAFGGGVVGDLAGFIAATWQRGVPLVMVPTTLLAQVDSAVGGKVAINFGGVKNNIGAFHQPTLVLSDTRLLATLPRREYRSALAEVVKYGMIADARLLGRLERGLEEILAGDPGVLATLVAACCRIKARIVVSDELESGSRAHLNYGHTLGHALEAEAGGRLRHGEAVALGMRAAARLGEELGYLTRAERERQDSLLDRLGLPRRIDGIDVDQVLAKLKWDKKVRHGKPLFVLTCGVGSASVAPPIDAGRVRRALADLIGRPTANPSNAKARADLGRQEVSSRPSGATLRPRKNRQTRS